jgi:hypothetical protein
MRRWSGGSRSFDAALGEQLLEKVEELVRENTEVISLEVHRRCIAGREILHDEEGTVACTSNNSRICGRGCMH